METIVPIYPGYKINVDGLEFIKTTVGIDVFQDHWRIATISTLANPSGVNYVRNLTDMETEIAFWLKENG